MKFKLLTPVLIGACIFISTSANAAPITVGALTLEAAGDKYVKDSLNGLEWLRWDQVNPKFLSWKKYSTIKRLN
jgi:hypothetical protein